MIDTISGVGANVTPAGTAGGVAKSASALAGGKVSGADGVDFASLLGNAISEFGQTMRKAEAVSIGGINGTAPLQDVVEHVMTAEQSLQTAIAIRDKVVMAYQEISRMPI